MKRTGPTNIQTRKLIIELRTLSSKQKAPIWKRIADELSKSTRNKNEVNLSRIEAHAKDKETIIVPGKVLGAGILSKDVVVAALGFSADARERISKRMTISELMKKNPSGKGVRILA